MGLIQRAVEMAGITTISVTLAKDITKRVYPPRAVSFGFPLGHPLGFPGRKIQQLQLLRALLKSLQEFDTPGTLIGIDMTATGIVKPVRRTGDRESGKTL